MNRVAASILLVSIATACKKHEDAPRVEATQAAPTDSSVTATAAPSAAASEAPVTSASASPSASAESARLEALRQAEEFGMLGLLPGDAGAPSNKGDPLAARGNMWGDAIGDSFGAGGLGSTGDAGGGRGEGIGLGNIGTLGHGAGTGTGQGFGSGHDRFPTGRVTVVPRIRQGTTVVNGRLPPEVIQRIVRQNFGRFRLCYETGLRADPKLSGKVATKFVIDTQGAVSSVARDASTTMPDANVVSCVTRAFSNLSFPQPEGGIVTVVFPVIFEPGD